MRILLVSQDFPPDVGGIQTYAAELAPRLAEQAEALAVVAPSRPGSVAVDHPLPFPVHRLPARPDLLPLVALPALPVLARRGRYTLSFHAQWQTVGAALLARRLTGFPKHIVCAAHGRELLFSPFPEDSALDGMYHRIRRTLLAGVDHFLPVSRYTGGLLNSLGVPESQMTVIPNGTNPGRFRPMDASALRHELGLGDRRVLLTVGRLVPRKGLDTTIRALPRIAEDVPNVTYLIVGSGPDRERLEALARRLGVSERLRFAGKVPNEQLPLYYNACDAFVMPSREANPDVEGFGIVFLEAGACGKPVIGARAGGVPDAIRDGETGVLIPPRAPERLARAAQWLLTHPEEATRIGEQGRQRVLHHNTWDHIAGRVFNTLSATVRH